MSQVTIVADWLRKRRLRSDWSERVINAKLKVVTIKYFEKKMMKLLRERSFFTAPHSSLADIFLWVGV